MEARVGEAPAYAIGQALEMMSEGAMIVDGYRHVVYANPAFTAVTGYARNDIIGGSCTVLHGPGTDQLEVERATQALAGGQTYRGEMLNYRQDRTPFWNALTISPLRDTAGEITHFAVLVRDVTRQKTLENQLRFQAHHDALTGLPNRAALDARLGQVEAPERHGHGLVVGIMDLDDFKPVNDRHGHAAGDQLLKDLATRLREALRDDEFIARLGGDEFVIVSELEPGRAQPQLERMARRLRRVVERPFEVKRGVRVNVGLSLGVTVCRAQADCEPGQLLRQADAALYEAKQNKGGPRRWWRAWKDTPAAPLPAVAHVPRLDGEVCMHFQPLVHLATGQVTRVEALARLRSADGQLRMPHEFIPELDAAELAQLFRRGLDLALPQLREWAEAGFAVGLGINLPPSVLVMPQCRDWVGQALAEHGVQPWQLDLELLEHDEPSGPAVHARAVASLREIGVHLVMDDLGSGFSSLERLYNLPFHMVKIDQKLVMRAAEDPERAIPFIGTLVRLAQRIGLRVVAEGLESRDLMEMAVALGVDYGQGYAIAKPMPVEDVLPWLRGRLWRIDVSDLVTPLGRSAALFSREALPLDWNRIIESHREWKSVLLRRASGEGRPLDWRLVQRDDACQLGQWLHRCRAGIGDEHRPLFEQVARIHQNFHGCAAGLVRKLDAGLHGQAVIDEISHGELDALSDRLVTVLEQLRDRVTTHSALPGARSRAQSWA